MHSYCTDCMAARSMFWKFNFNLLILLWCDLFSWLKFQMLSMRNGLSLHPMCFSEGLQPLQLPRMRMEFGEENRSMSLNMTAALPLHQENPLNYASSLPNKHTVPDQPSLPSPPYLINSDTSFGLDSSILAHIRPFQLRRSSEVILTGRGCEYLIEIQQ